jgi:hypothetical protein
MQHLDDAIGAVSLQLRIFTAVKREATFLGVGR